MESACYTGLTCHTLAVIITCSLLQMSCTVYSLPDNPVEGLNHDGRPGPSFLSQPVNRWELGMGQPIIVLYFYLSVHNLSRTAPLRPAAGRLPWPRNLTREQLSRCDGKHLGCCRQGCPPPRLPLTLSGLLVLLINSISTQECGMGSDQSTLCG